MVVAVNNYNNRFDFILGFLSLIITMKYNRHVQQTTVNEVECPSSKTIFRKGLFPRNVSFSPAQLVYRTLRPIDVVTISYQR